eukprot:gene12361-13453_t
MGKPDRKVSRRDVCDATVRRADRNSEFRALAAAAASERGVRLPGRPDFNKEFHGTMIVVQLPTQTLRKGKKKVEEESSDDPDGELGDDEVVQVSKADLKEAIEKGAAERRLAALVKATPGGKSRSGASGARERRRYTDAEVSHVARRLTRSSSSEKRRAKKRAKKERRRGRSCSSSPKKSKKARHVKRASASSSPKKSKKARDVKRASASSSPKKPRKAQKGDREEGWRWEKAKKDLEAESSESTIEREHLRNVGRWAEEHSSIYRDHREKFTKWCGMPGGRKLFKRAYGRGRESNLGAVIREFTKSSGALSDMRSSVGALRRKKGAAKSDDVEERMLSVLRSAGLLRDPAPRLTADTSPDKAGGM